MVHIKEITECSFKSVYKCLQVSSHLLVSGNLSETIDHSFIVQNSENNNTYVEMSNKMYLHSDNKTHIHTYSECVGGCQNNFILQMFHDNIVSMVKHYFI